MKKLLAYLMVISAFVCFTLSDVSLNSLAFVSAATEDSAVTDSATTTDTTLTEQEFTATSENVKLIGRTYLLDNTLWLANSGTGIEFTFTGTKAELTLVGDNIATASWAESSYCRYAIYVDDKLVKDELLKEATKTITAFESTKEKTVTIRFVKLSEAANSTIGIAPIKVNVGGVIKPTEAKSYLIEFIGDSITCGYGVDAPDKSYHFSTETEDFTKTYAYKVAQSLKADYSVVAASGYGIISGYTSKSSQINKSQLIPGIYDKIGRSGGLFNGTVQVDTLAWDFTQAQPDLIVINLGTNDDSYCKSDAKKHKTFEKGYIKFLKTVRAKNPDATILCTYGIMGNNMYKSIDNAVKSYTKNTKDKNVYAMQFDTQVMTDGLGADWHPSDTTHTKAAKKLLKEIKSIMKW